MSRDYYTGYDLEFEQVFDPSDGFHMYQLERAPSKPRRIRKPKATCKNGHDTRGIYAREDNGSCRQCKAERQVKWQQENREAINAYHREYYASHPERRQYLADYQREAKAHV